jgi:hypothetical protein
MYQLDHVVLAAPNLTAAKQAFARHTGVQPEDGGPHPGLGTRNALVGFDAHTYLEIIAPDPEQPGTGHFAARLAALTEFQLLHWAVRTSDLDAVARQAQQAGLRPLPVRRLSRRRGDGALLTWSVMGIGGHGEGGLVPFFIDWGDTPHPAATAPRVAAASLTVTAPADSAVLQLLAPPPAAVEVKPGRTNLVLDITTAQGTLVYRSSAPLGFTL